MSPTIVLVTFYSRNGATERLATAAGVGAVQARAGIRMRRLVESDREATLARHPESAATLQQMWKEYVPPKEADVLAAGGIVVGLPGDMSPASEACAPFFDLLRTLQADGRLSGKAAAVVGTGGTAAATADALRGLGFTVLDPEAPGPGDALERSVVLGRRLVATAESLKGSATHQKA
jgi:NAD(P)H dehydrogenase (quinone)